MTDKYDYKIGTIKSKVRTDNLTLSNLMTLIDLRLDMNIILALH